MIIEFLANPLHHTHINPYGRNLRFLLINIFKVLEEAWEKENRVLIGDSLHNVLNFKKYKEIFHQHEQLIWQGLVSSGQAILLAQVGKTEVLELIKAFLAISAVPERYASAIFCSSSRFRAARNAEIARLYLEAVKLKEHQQ